jgi:hypothetical protein
MIAARRPPAPEPVKKFVRPSAIGRLARSAAFVAHLEAKRVKRGGWRFFTAVFLARLSSRATDPSQTRHARMGETKTATPRPRPRLPDRYSKPGRARARPPRCSCRGRNVTVRLWWVGTPIPACRAALVGRQPRILSSLRQPDKIFPRVPKLPLPFSTSLVKPASTRGPDFETEIATLDEHWQERTIALMLRQTKAGDIGAPDDEHSPTPQGTQKESFPTLGRSRKISIHRGHGRSFN